VLRDRDAVNDDLADQGFTIGGQPALNDSLPLLEADVENRTRAYQTINLSDKRLGAWHTRSRFDAGPL
jgi:hypothetical protein